MSDTQANLIIKAVDEASSVMSGIGSAIGGLADKAQATGGKVVSFLGGALQHVTGGVILGGLSALKDGFGSVMDGMVKGNAQFETYATQFGVLLGGADAAKQRLADLAKFGASTPFELPQVVEADKILQGFGLHSEEAAKKFGFSGEQIRTIAGDVASGTGSSFSEMTLLLGKFSTGATGEAISRMAELGITSRDELAKMGLEFDKSGALLSPLPQSMEVVLKLMKNKYGGMMDAQSKTFDGMMSNLQDWVGGTLRTIGQPIFEVLKDKLGVLLQFLGSPAVQTAISTLATTLSTGIGAAVDYLVPVIDNIIGIVGKLPAMLGEISSSPTFGAVLTAFQSIFNWVVTNWPGIQAAIGSAITSIVGFVNDPLTPTINTIIALMAPILAWVVENWPLIQRTIGTVLTAIQTTVNTVMPALRLAFDVAFAAIKLTVQTVIDSVLGIVKAAMQLINGDTAGALKTLQETFGRVWERIKTVIGSAIEAIKPIIASGMLAVKEKILSLMGEAVTYMESLPAKFFTLGGNIIKGMWDGISGMSQWFRDKFSQWISATLPEWAQKLLGIASPSKVAAEEIGKPFVQGIMQGILDGSTALRGTIREVAGAMTFAPFGYQNNTAPATVGAGNINVSVYVDRVAGDVDIDEMAYRVAERIRRAQ
jgi:phage-related protein